MRISPNNAIVLINVFLNFQISRLTEPARPRRWVSFPRGLSDSDYSTRPSAQVHHQLSPGPTPTAANARITRGQVLSF